MSGKNQYQELDLTPEPTDKTTEQVTASVKLSTPGESIQNKGGYESSVLCMQTKYYCYEECKLRLHNMNVLNLSLMQRMRRT